MRWPVVKKKKASLSYLALALVVVLVVVDLKGWMSSKCINQNL